MRPPPLLLIHSFISEACSFRSGAVGGILVASPRPNSIFDVSKSRGAITNTALFIAAGNRRRSFAVLNQEMKRSPTDFTRKLRRCTPRDLLPVKTEGESQS